MFVIRVEMLLLKSNLSCCFYLLNLCSDSRSSSWVTNYRWLVTWHYTAQVFAICLCTFFNTLDVFTKTSSPKIMAFFRNFGLWGLWCKTQNHRFLRNCTLLQVEGFSLRPKMKELSNLFLKKSELQLRGNSILIAFFSFPPIWGSQNDMFQQKYFRSNIAFFDTGEIRVVKKNVYQKSAKNFE